MKKLIPALLLSAFCLRAEANLHLAPPDFDKDGRRAVFVDFKEVKYEISYYVKQRYVYVKSSIRFTNTKAGMPIFDLVPEVISLKVDGREARVETIKLPGGGSEVRLALASLAPGEHVLEIENTIDENVVFNTKSVSSAFWIRDLKDRMFLEQYVPSNLEFDQYKITMDVMFEDVKKASQDIYANGKITTISPTQFRIVYPEYFTVSCPYFHTTSKGAMERIDFSYRSISGREIPITVYSPWQSRTQSFHDEAIRVLQELEADYGPWPHPGLIAYGTMPGTGGMEHSGATATSLAALDHEMLHSYFAKGVMPANGNSGWLDEAIASWRDKGYQRLPDPGFGGSDLGNHSVYMRNTDKRAYALGAKFMAYLDWRLQNVGGLKAFLKGYFEAYKHQVITAAHFKNNLEFFSGLDLTKEFEQYVWGRNTSDVEKGHGKNPFHQSLSKQFLRTLL